MQFSGKHFKMLVENAKRMVMREFINNNVNAEWDCQVVSKEDVDRAIQEELPIYINYYTKEKGEHERVFIPTSVMYSSVKNRYRILGIDINKNSRNNDRVAFSINHITDWQEV